MCLNNRAKTKVKSSHSLKGKNVVRKMIQQHLQHTPDDLSFLCKPMLKACYNGPRL